MKIAIIKLSAMGDIIFAMAVLQSIRANFKTIQIDWFCDEFFAPILEESKEIDNIYKIPIKKIKKDRDLKELIRQIRFLKSLKYDLIIDLQGLIKSAIVAKLLNGKTIGFCKDSIKESFASKFYDECYSISYSENILLRNQFLVSNALNFKIDSSNLEKFIFFKECDFDFITEKFLLLTVGASFPSKIYPKEKFLEVVEYLKMDTVIVWGSESERKFGEFIVQNSKFAKLAPKLNLNELKALVSKASLVIGNDSGPTHLTFGLKVPSITLFGNTPSYRNTVKTAINKSLQADTKIEPKKINKSDFSIKNIEPKEIVKLAMELL